MKTFAVSLTYIITGNTLDGTNLALIRASSRPAAARKAFIDFMVNEDISDWKAVEKGHLSADGFDRITPEEFALSKGDFAENRRKLWDEAWKKLKFEQKRKKKLGYDFLVADEEMLLTSAYGFNVREVK